MANAMSIKMLLLLLIFCSVFGVRSEVEPTPATEQQVVAAAAVMGNNVQEEEGGELRFDFYREDCPQLEKIVWSSLVKIVSKHKNTPAELLRLLFHDCFVQGCDASVLLDDSLGNKNHSIERQAAPNKSLKGFDAVAHIKKHVEKACPGVVSCADLLVLAARDGIVLAGGPFYPVLTGRRDSNQSFYSNATVEIPPPDGSITETLRLFSLKGFNERETVALLGAHNIGKIGCEFIRPRLYDFKGTGGPDPTLSDGFRDEMSIICPRDSKNSRTELSNAEEMSMMSVQGMSYFQALSSSVPSGDGLDSHYYQTLIRGRGVLFADQQLMADQRTAEVVLEYSSDDASAFRKDFAGVMVKLSNLGALTGSQGQIRLNCSIPVTSSNDQQSTSAM